MEFIYYTIAAVLLYAISDYILNTIETRMGKRLANRSLIFLVIIMVLSITSFSIIQAIFQKPESTKESTLPASGQSLSPAKENKQ